MNVRVEHKQTVLHLDVSRLFLLGFEPRTYGTLLLKWQQFYKWLASEFAWKGMLISTFLQPVSYHTHLGPHPHISLERFYYHLQGRNFLDKKILNHFSSLGSDSVEVSISPSF